MLSDNRLAMVLVKTTDHPVAVVRCDVAAAAVVVVRAVWAAEGSEEEEEAHRTVAVAAEAVVDSVVTFKDLS